jgi:hypothetical protein
MPYDPKIPFNDLPDLPPELDIATRELLLSHIIRASRSLAELKGLCETMTEEALLNLLFNTVVIQESRDSSAIETLGIKKKEVIIDLLSTLAPLSCQSCSRTLNSSSEFIDLQRLKDRVQR